MASIEGFRLSIPQRRIWRAGEVCSGAHAQCVLGVEGHLDEPRLLDALRTIVARHEILRTSFPLVPGMAWPVQSVQPAGVVHLTTVDSTDPERLLCIDRAAPTALASIPVVRATLGRSILVLSVPALCADARTLINLVGEIGEVLNDDPPGETIQYGQYSAWQRELADSDEGRAARAFWQRESVAQSELSLPGRKRSDHFAPASVWTSLDGVPASPPATVLLATAWAVLVARFAGATRVEIGVLPNERPHPLLERALGPFAMPVPVPIEIDWNSTFEEAAARTETAFERARPRILFYDDETRRFPIQFAVEEWPDVVPAASATLRYRSRTLFTEALEVRLSAVWHGATLHIELAYDAERFDREAIRYLARSYTTLVERALENRGRPLRGLDPMAPTDRERVLTAWHRRVPYEAAPLGRLFERQAARTPEVTALEFKDQRMTFGELDARASEVADALRRRQVGPDGIVGLSSQRSMATIVGLLGILKAGGAYLPLDPLDPPERLREILARAQPRALLTAGWRVDGFQGLGVDVYDLGTSWPEVAGLEARVAHEPHPDNLAYVIFTSGSTGRPKGVLIRQGAVVNLLSALDDLVYRDLPPGCRVSLNAPLTVDASVKQWIQLLRGRTLHIVPDEVRLDPQLMSAHLRQYALEVLDCTPTQLRPLLDTDLPDGLVVLVGGEALDDGTWRRMLAHNHVRFVNVYGPTEATVDTTAAVVRAPGTTIGRPLPNTSVFVLDDEGALAPLGAPGEIYVGGDGVALGYLNDPARTAERFLPNPLSEVAGTRLYRTGDRARQALDGTIEFLGRLDHQVKLHGHRIELAEIEAAIEAHPGAHRASVVLHEGERRSLVAYVVADTATMRELPAHLRRRLPEFMVPAELVRMDRLPTTPGGKIDRRRLPSPGIMNVARPGAPRIAPRSELERIIAGIWCRTLQCDAVGVEDNFFDIGGHSLLIARVYMELRETLNRDFTMLELFRHPTIESLARVLAEPQAGSSAVVIQARAERQREAIARHTRPVAPEASR